MKQTLTILINSRNWQTIPELFDFHKSIRKGCTTYEWSITQQTVWRSAGGGAFGTVWRAVQAASVDALV